MLQSILEKIHLNLWSQRNSEKFGGKSTATMRENTEVKNSRKLKSGNRFTQQEWNYPLFKIINSSQLER